MELHTFQPAVQVQPICIIPIENNDKAALQANSEKIVGVKDEDFNQQISKRGFEICESVSDFGVESGKNETSNIYLPVAVVDCYEQCPAEEIVDVEELITYDLDGIQYGTRSIIKEDKSTVKIEVDGDMFVAHSWIEVFPAEETQYAAYRSRNRVEDLGVHLPGYAVQGSSELTHTKVEKFDFIVEDSKSCLEAYTLAVDKRDKSVLNTNVSLPEMVSTKLGNRTEHADRQNTRTQERNKNGVWRRLKLTKRRPQQVDRDNHAMTTDYEDGPATTTKVVFKETGENAFVKRLGKRKLCEELDCKVGVTSFKPRSNNKPFACQVCTKSFAQSGHLTVHMRAHTGEKPYQCKVCGASYAEPDLLTVHVRTHTEKPHSCVLCRASFALSASLAWHMRTHSREKPFRCKVCGASFSKSSQLAQHMRMYHGEKPYTCEVCGRSCALLSDLTVHMRKHTGEKPYSCKMCAASFPRSYALTRHMQTHTREKPQQIVGLHLDIRIA